MHHADIRLENETCYISGDLHLANVMSVYQKSLALFKKSPALMIDFSKLASSDSSGIALMIEWLKDAKKQQKKIVFQNLPEHLLSIIKAARLEPVILNDHS